jgi:hypothetical protein
MDVDVAGGEQFKIRDITNSVLESRLNPKLSKWAFKISRSDFSDVKKLSSINSWPKKHGFTDMSCLTKGTKIWSISGMRLTGSSSCSKD